VLITPQRPARRMLTVLQEQAVGYSSNPVGWWHKLCMTESIGTGVFLLLPCICVTNCCNAHRGITAPMAT
jgi:hypothetical protein